MWRDVLRMLLASRRSHGAVRAWIATTRSSRSGLSTIAGPVPRAREARDGIRNGVCDTLTDSDDGVDKASDSAADRTRRRTTTFSNL